MPDEINNVALRATATTIKTLFGGVDSEAIIPTTLRARATTISTTAAQLDATAKDLVLDTDSPLPARSAW
jgi:hypothetical protein